MRANNVEPLYFRSAANGKLIQQANHATTLGRANVALDIAPLLQVSSTTPREMLAASMHTMAAEDTRIIRLPSKLDREAIIELPVADIPDDAPQVLELLHAEDAALTFYHQFAVEYDRSGRHRQCLQVLEEALRNRPLEARELPGKHRERLLVHLALAGYHMREALTSGDPIHLEKTDSVLKGADLIDASHHGTLWMKSMLAYCRGEKETAMRMFARLPDAAPCFLWVKAIGEWQRKQNMESFGHLRKLGAPAALAAACCALAQGNLLQTKEVLMNDESKDPMTSVILAAVSKLEGGVSAASQNIMHARNTYPDLPLTLCFLAEQSIPSHPMTVSHFFAFLSVSSNFAKSQKYALQAERSALTGNVRAWALHLVGESYKALLDYTAACEYYGKALEILPNYATAQLALAQCLLIQQNHVAATAQLEGLLKTHPDHLPAKKLLAGLMYGSNRKNACRLLEAYVDKSPEDAGALIQLLIWKHVLGGYDSVQAHLLHLQEMLPKLENAMKASAHLVCGVAYHHLGKGEIARAHYEAVSGCSEDVVARYNLALLSGSLSDCRALAEEHPALVPVYQTLANLDHLGVAMNTAMAVDPNNVQTWLTAALINVLSEEWPAAAAKLEAVLKNPTAGKAQRSLAYACMGIVKHIGDKKAKDAARLFESALKLEKGNRIAANGLATILAVQGAVTAAAPVFAQLRHSSTETDEATLNAAHTLIEQNQPLQAAKLYEHYISCREGSLSATECSELHLHQARAYFLLGKSAKSRDLFHDALRCLDKAGRMCPANDPLTTLIAFNTALTLQEQAVLIMGIPMKQRTSADMEVACRGIDTALALFGTVCDPAPHDVWGLGETAGKRVKYCESLRRTAAQQHVKQREQETLLARQLENIQQMRETSKAKADAEEVRLLVTSL